MSRLRRDERGMVMVVAILVIATTLALGLATFAFTQDQQRQSGNERVKESAFNLAESALNSATNFLTVTWPTAASPYPTCTQSSGAGCPDVATVSSGFSSSDYAGAPAWTTNIYDNGAPTTGFFKKGTTDTQPSYDANNDGMVWARASATARGKTRTVVGLVKAQPISETFPRNVVTGFRIQITVPQNFVIVDERGFAATPSSVALRCTQAGPPSSTSTCAQWIPGYQIQPGTYQLGATHNACPDATLRCALTEAELDRLRQTAKAQNNYYGGVTCPTAAQVNRPGGIVFAEACTSVTLANAGDLNSRAAPGMLVNRTGSITIGGTNPGTRFYGIVYAPNRGVSAGNVVSVIGGGHIVGAVAADYNGVINLGTQISQQRTGVIYDPNVFNLLSTNGPVTITPGSFREL